MTGGVTLATVPVVAYYFNQISWVGLFANLIVVPIAGFVLVPVGLASGIWYVMAGSEAFPASHMNQLIGEVLCRVVEVLAGIPHAEWHVASPSFPAMVVFYVCLAMAIRPLGSVWLKRCSVAMVALILTGWMWSPRPW